MFKRLWDASYRAALTKEQRAALTKVDRGALEAEAKAVIRRIVRHIVDFRSADYERYSRGEERWQPGRPQAHGELFALLARRLQGEHQPLREREKLRK
jgi:hypothetical protein